jgi:parallel beta-helix repeat protein
MQGTAFLIAAAIALGLMLLFQLAAPPDALYAPSNTLYTGQDYPSLTAAIQAAKPGNTIIVMPGLYRENVAVDKPLRIISWGQVMASIGKPLPPEVRIVIQARDPAQPVFKVLADGVRLSGLVIEGGSAGVEAVGVKGAKLIANVVRGSEAGLVLRGAQGSLLQGNEVRAKVGLVLEAASGNKLIGNEVFGGELGLRLSDSQENELKGNKFEGQTAVLLQASHRNSFFKNRLAGSERGLVLDRSGENLFKETELAGRKPLELLGEAVEDWLQEIDTTNKVEGRAIYYLVGKEGLELTPAQNPGYLALIRCKNITVSGVELEGGQSGLLLIETEGVTLRNNRLFRAEVGLKLWRTKNSLLEGNTITGGEVGIHLLDSSGEILSRNSVSGSDLGILIEGGAATSWRGTRSPGQGGGSAWRARMGIGSRGTPSAGARSMASCSTPPRGTPC